MNWHLKCQYRKTGKQITVYLFNCLSVFFVAYKIILSLIKNKQFLDSNIDSGGEAKQ